MRIALVITLPELGGAQSHVRAVVAEMRERGHEVAVLSAGEGWLHEEALALGAEPVSLWYLGRAIRPRDLLALGELRAELKRLKPDVVHLHSTKAGLLGRVAARLAGVRRVVFTAHGFVFHERLAGWKLAAAVAVERLAARFTDAIVAVSRYDAERAARFRVGAPGQVRVVYNGLDFTGFPAASRAEARARLGLAPDAEVLLMVARFAPQKDHPTFRAALEPLLAERPGLHAYWIGTGPQFEATRAGLAADGLDGRIHCLGDRTDVPLWLAAADAFVLSTHYEGLPITILEAMASGLPVVASDVGGVSEEVEAGVTGRLVPPRDPVALRGALRTLLDDPAGGRRMGQAGAERARRLFSARAMGDALEAIYRGE